MSAALLESETRDAGATTRVDKRLSYVTYNHVMNLQQTDNRTPMAKPVRAPLAVRYGFDTTENLFFVVSSDVPGLNVVAASLAEMEEIAYDFLPDLLGERANGARLIFMQSGDPQY